MIWRIAPSLLLLILSMHAWAIKLDPACHKLYEMFNLPDLSYEDVGKIADKMHENECWPVLQGLITMDEPGTEQSLPTIANCDSLAPHIEQMTKAQETYDNPAIVKLYGIKPLTAEFCNSEAMRTLILTVALSRIESQVTKACLTTHGKVQESEGEPTKILNCIGTARYSRGNDADIYFYLERFPDGEEFLGVSAVIP